MPSPAHIRIVGARQNNLRNLSLDLPLGELTVITGVSGFRQVLAGLRHPLCRGPAALYRDLFALRAAVPRPHGTAPGGPHRGNSPGHRHRPDQSGAHLALHRRDDDRDQRSPQAAVCPRGAAVLPGLRPAGAARYGRIHSRVAFASAPQRWAIRACWSVLMWRARPTCRKRNCARCCRRRAMCGSWRTSRQACEDTDRHPGPLSPGAARVRTHRRSTGGRAACRTWTACRACGQRCGRDVGHLAVLLGPALRRMRHLLPGSTAQSLLVQFAAGRLRNVQGLRSRHRHRLRDW